jgi:hypothetical protein
MLDSHGLWAVVGVSANVVAVQLLCLRILAPPGLWAVVGVSANVAAVFVLTIA